MKEIKKIVAKILEIEESKIDENSSPENIESWDSFNSLMIVSEIEDYFKMKFSTEEILAVKTLGDILRVIKSRDLENTNGTK